MWGANWNGPDRGETGTKQNGTVERTGTEQWKGPEQTKRNRAGPTGPDGTGTDRTETETERNGTEQNGTEPPIMSRVYNSLSFSLQLDMRPPN